MDRTDNSSPSALPPAVRELLPRLTAELAGDRAWRERGCEHVFRDAAAGVCVVLKPLIAPPTPTPTPTRERPLRGRLSARELQIAAMIAEGHSNKTIGYELGISIWTVSTHLRRIFSKLEVRSRAAMVGRLAEIETPIGNSAPRCKEDG